MCVLFAGRDSSVARACSPPIESKHMRYGMLAAQEELLGRTRAFDGTVLFLPTKITDNVSTDCTPVACVCSVSFVRF